MKPITHLISRPCATHVMHYGECMAVKNRTIGYWLAREFPHLVRINPQVAVNPAFVQPTYNYPDIAFTIGNTVYWVTKSLRKDIAARFRLDTTRPPQIMERRVLEAVRTHPGLNILSIAAVLDHNPVTVNNAARRLEKQNLISTSPRNGRAGIQLHPVL